MPHPRIHHDTVEGCEDIGKPGYVEPEKIHLKIIMGLLYEECKTGYVYYETTASQEIDTLSRPRGRPLTVLCHQGCFYGKKKNQNH